MTEWNVTDTQLGLKGKDGIVMLGSKGKGNDPVAIKNFKKTHSVKKLKEEAKFQQIAFEAGIAPEVYEVDIKGKRIIMEKMDMVLPDIIRRQKGKLTIKQQKRLFKLTQIIYSLGFLHNDANPRNYMSKNGKLYYIDFGFAAKLEKDDAEPAYYSLDILLNDEERGLVTRKVLNHRPEWLEKKYLEVTGERLLSNEAIKGMEKSRKIRKLLKPMTPGPIRKVKRKTVKISKRKKKPLAPKTPFPKKRRR